MELRAVAAGAALGLGVIVGTVPADAAFVPQGTFPGNDCTGSLGTSPTCTLNNSPQILKVEFKNDGTVDKYEINPLFSSIDGSEFSFTFGANGTGSGNWFYNPDNPTDPIVTAYSVKGGTDHTRYITDGTIAFTGQFSTPINPNNNKPFGLSHIVFYDTVVPLPAALPLLGTGLLALWGIGRMRSRQAEGPIAA